MKFLTNLSLRAKLLTLCVFLSAVSILIATTGYNGLRNVAKSYEEVSDRVLPSLNALNGMYLSYRSIRINLRTLGLPGLSKAQADEAVKNVHEAIAQYEELDKAYKALPFQDGQGELYEKVNGAWAQFKNVGGRALALHALGSAADQALLLKIFLEECPLAAATYDAALHKLTAYHNGNAKNDVLAAKKDSAEANRLMLTLSVLGLLAGATLGFFLSQNISGSIARVVATLNQNSREVDSASTKIASYAESLSQATTEQAASLQETAASLEEITAMITKAAGNANGTSESSQESLRKAQEGRDSMKEMLVSMEQINGSNADIMDQITESNRRMAEIVKVIEEIGAKTRVINDIVFQTKLLSFNASVEAARAGEHGKGFAVVAEEVGNLAQMSGNAAKEISSLLEDSTATVNGIVAETKSKVDTILGQGKEKVDAGVRVAEKCSHILEDIVHNVSQVSGLAQEIATASQEQSQGVAEINKAMGQLDSVSQSNASASQNTAMAADDLTAQANSLKIAVASLELIITGGAAAPTAPPASAKVVELGGRKSKPKQPSAAA